MSLIRLSLSGSVGWHASQVHPEARLRDYVKMISGPRKKEWDFSLLAYHPLGWRTLPSPERFPPRD